MSKEKSFIYFEIMELEEAATKWAVRGRGDKSLLGTLTYYDHWKGWVFTPANRTIWSAGCLEEVQRELRRLNREEAKPCSKGE